MKSTALSTPSSSSPSAPERVDAGQAHAEENGVIPARQFGQREVATQRLAVLDGDAADPGDVVDFRLRESRRASCRRRCHIR
jgi:hypothetical protein